MPGDNVILRFSNVTYEYDSHKHILEEASFSVRQGSRITLMGQNGAGKSTLFKMITGEIKPTEGEIHITPKDSSIAIARQVMPKDLGELSIRDYFATAFTEKKYNLDKLIKDVFEVVNIELPLERIVKACSGGQQARLLLAHALIQEPDILLLDEPTNNLDHQGIEHLTGFLMMYEKTVIVISHDAEFLNAFSDGVLYLDVFTHKVEQYTGNYYDVVEEIKARMERENLQNARMQSEIKEKRSQAEVFAHKGGKLRAVAKRMREAAEDAEENIVEVRQEDRTIREFSIPVQDFGDFFDGKVLEFSSISAIHPVRENGNSKNLPADKSTTTTKSDLFSNGVKGGEVVKKNFELMVRKNTHVLISGPNGIGKTTMLEELALNSYEGCEIAPNIKIGYYKQDFGNLDFQQKAIDCLKEVMVMPDDHVLRSVAAGFLLDGKVLERPIGALSEGQKGLLAFCRLVLMRPGLLVLDEPTNHINFRHLPIIAKALYEYEGAMLMVSHIPDFVSQIRVDAKIDLSSI